MDSKLLKASFQRIQERKQEFAATIYENLFQREPRAREFFTQTSMQRQYSSILATLTSVITGIERGEDFRPTLRKLGQRHHAYQIPPSIYPAMADAILYALAQFDPEWTPALRAAWGEAIEQIATVMMESYEPEAKIYRVQIQPPQKKRDRPQSRGPNRAIESSTDSSV